MANVVSKENASPYPSLNVTSSLLIKVVQELSLAHSIEEVMKAVRTAARQLAHADGATFVLRENEKCYYADEDAISPLWKGMKFPLNSCISGWCMLHKEQLHIQDIYQDDRIPHDAYRPTFVKSLAMTPIRKNGPIGAIGAYWANTYTPSPEELDALQALADATSIAIKNLETLKELEKRVQQLEIANQQLSRLTWMASHDLKEPLRSISMHASLLEESIGEVNSKCKIHFEKIKLSIHKTQKLITDLLEVSQIENHQKSLRTVDLNSLINNVIDELNSLIIEKNVQIHCGKLPMVWADPILLSRVFQNIFSNAIKFHENKTPQIDISSQPRESFIEISVRDNGIGIPSKHYEKIFDFFTHIHDRTRFPGTGVGLALCKKIIEDLGGKIWVESEVGKGSCFHFTLPRSIL